MASKQPSKKVAVHAPADRARTFWLAGLGAVSIARKRGKTVFADLIGEGQDFQTRVEKLTREISADSKAQIKGALAPVRAAIEQNVQKAGKTMQKVAASALSRIGVPSKADIEELTRRVTALSRQLKTR